MKFPPRYHVTAILLASGLLAGCGSESKPAAAAAAGPARRLPLVTAVPAQTASIAEQLETVGEVVATNVVTIQATIEGPIGFYPWREGDVITAAGQKLVQIDRPLYRQEVQVAEAALAVAAARLADVRAGARPEEVAQARESVVQLEQCTEFTGANRARVEALVQTGALPVEAEEKARLEHVKCQTQLASAHQRLSMLEIGATSTALAVQEALVMEAQARLNMATARLDECRIVAPFAGIVTRVFVRAGDLATVRAPLLEIMDPISLVVRFAVPEKLAVTLQPGAAAAISLDAYPGQNFAARVQRIYPQLDRQTRTRTAELVLDEPLPLMPGMFARVKLTARFAENAVTVADQAILTTPKGEKIVFVLADNKVRRRSVTTGLEQNTRVQILAGVDAGELVLVAGHANLGDGAEVRLPPPQTAPGGSLAAQAPGGQAQ